MSRRSTEGLLARSRALKALARLLDRAPNSLARVAKAGRRYSCSRCGGSDALHVITYGYEGSSLCGRLLVYCASCRAWAGDSLGASVPVERMTTTVFEALYELGFTESDPVAAAGLAFGGVVPRRALRAARRAERRI